MTNYPLQLKTGDKINIIAPASGRPPEIIAAMSTALKAWGLNPSTPPDLLGNALFCSNTLDRRFTHLQEALLDPDSKLIWCLRGGYGSAQLIPLLEKMPKPKAHKWLMGFSDVTALHLFLQQHWGWPSIHGPQAASLIDVLDKTSITKLHSFLTDPHHTISFSDLTPLNVHAQKIQTITAPIIGGNLSLLQTSIGTSWQLNAQDKIVLMEDIGERAYRTDRTLLHLMQSQVLSGAKAILLGDFTDSKEPDGTNLTNTMLQRFADQQSIPVLRIPHVGHGASNWPVVLGVPATLSYSQNNFMLEITQ